jgi:uncharacterized protein YndB with AHSA1/START domain
MAKPSFVYVTYIATTPEKLFDALSDPEMTRQYWYNHRNASDWKPGSPWQHQDFSDPKQVHIAGRVVEVSRPKRLVITWHHPGDESDQSKHSKVTFLIDPLAGVVRLTVTHEDLEAGSPMLEGITKGWPEVLASLKTLLETGRPLPRSTGK